MGVRATHRPGRGGETTLGRPAAKRDEILARLRGGPQQLVGVERRSDAAEPLAERRQDADRDVAETGVVLERAS